MFFRPLCTILRFYEHLNLTFIRNINITTKLLLLYPALDRFTFLGALCPLELVCMPLTLISPSCGGLFHVYLRVTALLSSARKKMRHNDHDRRRTGGGPSTAESLSSVERIAMESIASVTVFGIDGGFDSNDPGYSVNYGEAAQSSSGVNNVSVSAILAENSEILGESLSEDSQISFNFGQPIVQPAAVHHTSSPTPSLDVHHRPRSTSSSFSPSGSSDDDSSLPLAADPAPPTPPPAPPTPRIVTGILRPQPRILFPQPRGPALQRQFRRPFLQPRQIRAQPRQPGPRAPSPLVSANIPRLQSNRTVTRDIRKDEFKQLLKQHELTNKYLQQLVELKRRKYEFEYGIDIMAPMDSTDSDN